MKREVKKGRKVFVKEKGKSRRGIHKKRSLKEFIWGLGWGKEKLGNNYRWGIRKQAKSD